MATLIQDYLKISDKYQKLLSQYKEAQKEIEELKEKVNRLSYECMNTTCEYRIPHLSDDLKERMGIKEENESIEEIKEDTKVETEIVEQESVEEKEEKPKKTRKKKENNSEE